MPELPEVETMVRGVRPHLIGRRLVAMIECPCACRPISMSPGWPEFVGRVVEATVSSVRRIGKRAVIEMSTGEAIAVEPRMTGLLLLADPPDPEHLRIEWRFQKDQSTTVLWFWDRRGLGTVRLHRPEELKQLENEKLGRDALLMTVDDWKTACKSSRREIKTLLLDQTAAAGIGNLYASEILHRAGIRPTTPACKLTDARLARLTQAVQEILNDAIHEEGSTLGDATYRTALNINGRYQNRHRVYKKQGESCPSCGKGTIERIVQAQRSTFFCPRCQK